MKKNRKTSWHRTLLGLGLLLVTASTVWAQVANSQLEERDGLWYVKGGETPYSGPVAGDDGPTGEMKDGRRTGTWIWTYEDGEKQFEMVYDNGTRIKGTGWHANGKIESEMAFKDGIPNGPRRSWDDEGHLRHEEFFVDGKRNGRETVRDQNGAVLYTADYKDGEPDGEVVWWYADGTPRWTTHYEAGARSGRWSQMAPDGELMMESTWDAGKLVSRDNPHEGH
jgi:antitoxin component YwqK of YwqJK toxin-antitoxin module